MRTIYWSKCSFAPTFFLIVWSFQVPTSNYFRQHNLRPELIQFFFCLIYSSFERFLFYSPFETSELLLIPSKTRHNFYIFRQMLHSTAGGMSPQVQARNQQLSGSAPVSPAFPYLLLLLQFYPFCVGGGSILLLQCYPFCVGGEWG